MLQLNIKVNQAKSKPAQAPVKFSKRRAIAAGQPCNEVSLTYYEEQQLYDRMYESEVWKNGHFFGYRSSAPAYWHDSQQAQDAAAEPIKSIKSVLAHQANVIDTLTDGELKREHRYCLSNKLFKEIYGEDK